MEENKTLKEATVNDVFPLEEEVGILTEEKYEEYVPQYFLHKDDNIFASEIEIKIMPVVMEANIEILEVKYEKLEHLTTEIYDEMEVRYFHHMENKESAILNDVKLMKPIMEAEWKYELVDVEQVNEFNIEKILQQLLW